MPEVHFFDLYGMWGPITDPGARTFTGRVKSELGAIIHGSPYRDYDVNLVVADIMATPADAVLLACGTSLGANNVLIVAQYLQLQSKRPIHGVFGFQASIYGTHSTCPDNVLFAHLFRSDNPFPFPGLGAYTWTKTPGNIVTNLYVDTRNLPHPGDGDTASQDIFLGEMKRIVVKPMGKAL